MDARWQPMVQAKQARFATRLAEPSERRTFIIASGAEVARALELHVLVVAGRQAAEGLGNVDHRERAGAREVGAGLARGERAGGFLHRVGEGLVVAHRDAPRATHGDRLQVLGPHHGADTGAPGGPVEVVHHAGVAVEVLAGTADRGDLDRAVLVARLDRRLSIPDRLAPNEAFGVDQFGVVVLDIEIDGARRSGPSQITMSQPASFNSAPK